MMMKTNSCQSSKDTIAAIDPEARVQASLDEEIELRHREEEELRRQELEAANKEQEHDCITSHLGIVIWAA